MEDPLFFGAAVLLFGVFALGYRRWHRRRSEALQRLAFERGWRYSERDDGLVDSWAHDFPLFGSGDPPRRCVDVIAVEQRGLAVTFADYSHRVWGTDDDGNRTSSTERHAVAVATLPTAVPPVRLGGENALTRLGNALRLRDIEIGSAEFDRRFRIRGDEPTARALLDHGMVHLLLGQPYDTWEVSGLQLLVSRRGRWKVEEYPEVLHLVERFVAAIPRGWQREAPSTP